MRVLLLLLLVSIAVGVGCVAPYKHYRSASITENNNCTIQMPKSDKNWNYGKIAEYCLLQTIFLPDAADFGIENRFKLSFIEFSEKSNKHYNSEQLLELQKLLRKNKNKFVIVFVHGWRNDAAISNTDVNKFRTLLAYSRKFLNQRRSKYKNAEVIGVYIGWRGKSINEYGENEVAKIATVWPSFWKRKNLSEMHSSLLVKTIDEIKKSAKLNETSKMLVIGHSFGANMLMTGLEERANNRIEDHSKGNIFSGLLGDLVVLINPATEASRAH